MASEEEVLVVLDENAPFAAAQEGTSEAQGETPTAEEDVEESSSGEDDTGTEPEALEDLDLSDLTEEDLRVLEEFAEQSFQERLKEVLPQIQSGWDRRNAVLQRQLEEYQRQMDEIRRQLREAQAQGLPPEEREKLERIWEFEDQKSALQKYHEELTQFYNDLVVQALLQQYGEYGVTEEMLREAGSLEEAEALCLRVQNEFQQALLEEIVKAIEGLDLGDEKKPAVAKKGAQGKKPPAGSVAASEAAGAPTTPPQGEKTSAGGIDALAESFRSGWQTLRF